MMRKFFLIFATILCLCGQAAAQNGIMTIISMTRKMNSASLQRYSMQMMTNKNKEIDFRNCGLSCTEIG